MTKIDAINQAREEVRRHGFKLALVIEGPHADEFAEYDADGHSYGFCPVSHISVLYPHGTYVEEVS